MSRYLASICLLCLLGTNATAQQAGLNDITIISVDIGHFEFGNRIIHIFENSRNKLNNDKNYKAWQFNVEPTLTVTPGEDGCIEAQSTALPPVRKTEGRTVRILPRNRVMVPLTLAVASASKKAIDVINKLYPETKSQIDLGNVDVLPITRIEFSISDVESKTGFFNKAVSLVNKRQYFHSTPMKTFLIFDVAENEMSGVDGNLRQFLKLFPYLDIVATVTFNVKGATYNLAGINREDVKNTELVAKLSGYGSLVYVTRDDMRKLTEQSVTQLKATFIMEDSNTIADILFNKMIEASTRVPLDLEKFDEATQKKTYNAKDLDPSVIKRFFSSEFEKVNEKWSRKTSASSGGGGSFLGIIKASGSNSYSNDQFKEFLREHGLTVEIEGNNIIPKSVEVQELNIGKFNATLDFGIEVRQLSKTGVKSDLPITLTGAPVDEEGKLAEGSCSILVSSK